MEQKTLGARICELRRSKGLTQQQFGAMLSVSMSTVSKWETGFRLPDIVMLNKMAEIFGCTTDELLNGFPREMIPDESDSNDAPVVEAPVVSGSGDINPPRKPNKKKLLPIIICIAIGFIVGVVLLLVLNPIKKDNNDNNVSQQESFNLSIVGVEEGTVIDNESKTISAAVAESVATFNLSQLQFPTNTNVVVEAYADEDRHTFLGNELSLLPGTNTFYVFIKIGDKTTMFVFTIDRLTNTVQHEHDFGAWNIITPATCTSEGTKERVCACGEKQTESIPALDHNIIHHEAKAPTCTEIGWDAYDTCSRCDYSTYAEKAALNHDYDAVVTEPTCTEQGYMTHTCSRCHDSYVDTYIDAIEHDWAWVIDTEATLRTTGIKHEECTLCHIIRNDNTIIPVLVPEDCSHDNKDKIEAIGTTCTTTGKEAYWYCKDCDKYFSDEACQLAIDDIDAFGIIPALSHDVVHHNAQAATCTEIGWDAYDTCSRCDYSTYAEKPALGHDWQWVVDVAATKISTGVKHEECSRCHIKQNEGTEIPLVDCDHSSATKTNAVAATCTTMGKEAYWYCEDCDKYFSDETCQLVIDDIDTFGIISALNHDIVHHNAQAATCTAIGWDAYDTCSRCDYTTYEEIPALGHTEVIDAAVAATCTATGLTEGKHCSVCNAVLLAQEVVPAQGHDIVHHNAQAATCTEIGWDAYDTCSRCDYSTYEAIPALGHDVVHHNAQAATCTEIGWDAYDTCSRCDYTTYVEKAMIDHAYDEYGVCTVCGNEYATDGLLYTLTPIFQNSYNVSGYEGTDTEIYIPSTYNGKPVVSIKADAFKDCTEITYVSIPSSVKTINAGAFSGCSSLETIVVPFVGRSVGNEDYKAFGYIFGTNSYTGSMATEQIIGGDYVTYYLPESLENVIIRDGTILTYAFYNCSTIKNVKILSNANIGSNAFVNCGELKTVYVPDTVTEFGSLVFNGSNKVQYTTYNGAKYIGNESNPYVVLVEATSTSITSCVMHEDTNCVAMSALNNCSEITTLTIGSKVEHIGPMAFVRCGKVKTLVIPNSVKSIGGIAFSQMSSLTSVTIGTGLTKLNHSLFSSCTSLKTISIPSTIESVGEGVFSGCSSLTYTTYSTGKYLGNNDNPYMVLVSYTGTGTNINSIHSDTKIIAGGLFRSNTTCVTASIPANVETISEHAFISCSSLTTVSMGISVKTIETSAFRSCTSLATINYAGTKAQWNAIDKQTNWNSNIKSGAIVRCTDGDITIG